MRRWYVLYTKPRQERRAKQNFENQNVESYLPMMKADEAKAEKGREVMFPRYIFVLLDDEKSNFSTIKYTRGVVDFVRFENTMATVSSSLIQSIEYREDKGKEPIKISGVKSLVSTPGGCSKYVDMIVKTKSSADRSILLLDILRNDMTTNVKSTQSKNHKICSSSCDSCNVD